MGVFRAPPDVRTRFSSPLLVVLSGRSISKGADILRRNAGSAHALGVAMAINRRVWRRRTRCNVSSAPNCRHGRLQLRRQAVAAFLPRITDEVGGNACSLSTCFLQRLSARARNGCLATRAIAAGLFVERAVFKAKVLSASPDGDLQKRNGWYKNSRDLHKNSVKVGVRDALELNYSAWQSSIRPQRLKPL